METQPDPNQSYYGYDQSGAYYQDYNNYYAQYGYGYYGYPQDYGYNAASETQTDENKGGMEIEKEDKEVKVKDINDRFMRELMRLVS